jgi:PKD repeat protein
MKYNLFLFVLPLFILSACKKEEENEDIPSVTFTATSGYTALPLPKTISFTASSNGADQINWDFGDGTTGQGFSVQHAYTAYGNYKVKATAVRGSQSASVTRDVPITFHRRVEIKSIRVLQVPTFKAGGLDWDPADDPDLMYKITFPGDTVFAPSTVINNSTTGVFTLAPPQDTFVFTDDVQIDLFDYDAGNVPDKETMGFLRFRFSEVIPTTVNYVDSIDVSSNSMRMIVKFEFIL